MGYQKPSVTTDLVLLRLRGIGVENYRKPNKPVLEVLLCNKTIEQGKLALPGGFLNIEEQERLTDNVKRKLQIKTGIVGDFYMEQLYTYDDPLRDTRDRVISVAYLGLANAITCDTWNYTTDCYWLNIFEVIADQSIPLAFDHRDMIAYALERLRNKIEYTDIAFELLNPEFTMRECQDLYELILGKPLLNFRRAMVDTIEPTNNIQMGKQFRHATLYRKRLTRKSKFGE